MYWSRAKAVIVSFFVMYLVAACGPAAKNVTLVGAPEARPINTGEEYKIHIGDTLDVKFYYNPELNEQVTVRPDGRISLQLVPEISAAGLTPAELTESLRQKYAGELAQPELSIIIRSFAGRKVFVDGEVNLPGSFDAIGPMTIRQYIALAGGIKNTARTNEIIVIRQEASKGPVVITADLRKINDGTALRENIPIYPNDIVYVPKSPIANVDTWVQQYIRDLLPVVPTPSVPAF